MLFSDNERELFNYKKSFNLCFCTFCLDIPHQVLDRRQVLKDSCKAGFRQKAQQGC